MIHLLASLHLPAIPLMPIRQHELASALAGLRATGVPLVGLADGRLVAAGASDAPGLYAFVPLLAARLGISLGTATTLFLGGIVLAGAVAGAVGWLRYARGALSRAVGLAGILVLSALALSIGDSYAVAAALVVGTVPSLLAQWRRGSSPRRWLATMGIVGLLVGTAGTVRNGAGLPVALFAGVLTLVGGRLSLRGRAALVAVLVATALVPALAGNALLARRDAYLAAHVPGYQSPVRGHVFWHTAYIGFGFLSNSRGLLYRDEVAIARVAAIDSTAGLGSERYESILRGEVLRLLRDSPAYVARTLAAKLGVLGAYLLLFANLGLLAATRVRKPLALDLAFGGALTVAAVPGLIAIPVLQYLEGFTALAFLFGVVSLEWWLGARRCLPGEAVPASVTSGDADFEARPEAPVMVAP